MLGLITSGKSCGNVLEQEGYELRGVNGGTWQGLSVQFSSLLPPSLEIEMLLSSGYGRGSPLT